MYTFRFIYFDEKYQDYEHIEKAEYHLPMLDISVNEEEIFSHNFPTDRDIRLFSKDVRYIVSGKNVKSIVIRKEID